MKISGLEVWKIRLGKSVKHSASVCLGFGLRYKKPKRANM